MGKRLKIVIFLSWALAGSAGYSQVPAGFLPDQPGEKIRLQTDRSVYIAGENILFSAGYKPMYDTAAGTLSKVLYTELVTWKGERVTGVKTRIADGMSRGEIVIPGELLSGTYYLTTYTRWMLNYGPGCYAYLPVVIVNPYSDRVLEGPVHGESDSSGFVIYPVSEPEDLVIDGLEDVYGKRTPVEISFGSDRLPADGRWTISVTKKGTVQPGQSVKNNASVQSNFRFFPETRGLSLSGRVRDPETGNPLGGVRLYLSTTFDPYYFASAVTRQDGGFLFTFPHYSGIHEYHLKASYESPTPLEILVDAEYSNHEVQLPYIPFSPDSSGKDLLLEMTRNVQLQEQFTKLPDNSTEETRLPFYGNPTRTLYMDDYIELNDLEEFFFELVYEVSVRKWGASKAVFASGVSTLSNNPALLLMDNMIVEDTGELLKLSCNSIDRVEVVWNGYAVGDKLYGGIVSLYSKKHDRAGLTPPGKSIYFDYALLSEEQAAFPEFDSERELNIRVPSRLNTLYWNPAVPASADSTSRVMFYTGDETGTFEVVVRGIGNDGEAIEGRGEFRVENVE